MLGLQERLEALGAQFTAPAALFDTAKRGIAGGGKPVVDADHAGLQLFGEPKHTADITREGISA